MKKILKIANVLWVLFFIGFMVYMLMTGFNTMKLSKILIVLCIVPIIMVPYFVDRIFSYKIAEGVVFLYYLFIFLSLVLGSILGFYSKIWWFDLFTHFSSGILTSYIAYVILLKNNITRKNNRFFWFLFILVFTIAIAGCWEFFEFICDIMFHQDAQKVIPSGVTDTMTDMLIATGGGIVSVIYCWFFSPNK